MSTCMNQPPQKDGQNEALKNQMGRIKQKLLVMSGKGGVGKSTVSVNLALSLAQAGHKVGLLDIDLHGPSIPTLLGMQGQKLMAEADNSIAPIWVSDNLAVVSIGLILENNTDPVIWRGPMKYGMIQQFLRDVRWGDLDVLVVDSPPGTGDEPLAIAEMIGSGARAVLVTTPQDVAVNDVRRSVSFCHALNLEIAGIVENMSGLVCPHCEKIVEVFKTGGGEKLATEMQTAFLGRIPLDPRIVLSGDGGRPFSRDDQSTPAQEAFAAMVTELMSPATSLPETTPVTNDKETDTMKFAIPTAQGKLCMHFGHCEQFTIVEANEADQTIISQEQLTPPPHEPGVLPRWLGEQGANMIIAGGMGQRAQSLFTEQGIQVLVGAPSEAPEDLVKAYMAGKLQPGTNSCDH